MNIKGWIPVLLAGALCALLVVGIFTFLTPLLGDNTIFVAGGVSVGGYWAFVIWYFRRLRK